MKRIIIAALVLLPTIVYSADSKYEEFIGKQYWITGKMFSLHPGTCRSSSSFSKRYEAKGGQSLKITGVASKVPYDDGSGYWDGFNIEIDNGDIVCADVRFFKHDMRSLSETNPSDEYSNKKYWVKSYSRYEKYYKGACGDYKEEEYRPKVRQSFIVNKYMPDKHLSAYKHDKAEILFDDGQIACVDIHGIKYSTTSEDPSSNEASIKKELEAAGIKKGATIWLKYPMKGLPGLTKLTVTSFDIVFDDISITFDSDDYEPFTKTFSSLSGITDNVYLKLPKKLSHLSKKARSAISNQQVFLGMSTDEAIASWGRPSDINRTAGAWGVHEQWVYGDNTYIYFKNGKLTSWQD